MPSHTSNRRLPPSHLAAATLTAALAGFALLCGGCSHPAPASTMPAALTAPAAGSTYSASEAQARQQAWAQSQEAMMKAQMQNHKK